MYPKGKLYFKNPKIKECMGYAEAGTCLDCIKRDSSKIACKKLGEYLDKKDWNRIMKDSPFYSNDYKAREATTSPDMRGNEVRVDRKGRPKNGQLLFRPRKVA